MQAADPFPDQNVLPTTLNHVVGGNEHPITRRGMMTQLLKCYIKPSGCNPTGTNSLVRRGSSTPDTLKPSTSSRDVFQPLWELSLPDIDPSSSLLDQMDPQTSGRNAVGMFVKLILTDLIGSKTYNIPSCPLRLEDHIIPLLVLKRS
jgi:hypothetical protein